MPLAARTLVVLAICITTIGCDRVTKQIAQGELPGEPRSYLGGTLTLQYAENAGAFLGFGAQWPTAVRTIAFTITTGAMLVWLAGMAVAKRRDFLSTVGLSFFVAGGLSNWIDRALTGRVVDFIVVGRGMLHTGIFNLADVAIAAGVVILVVAHVLERRRGSAA
jgi:signal peptidase II